MSNLFKKVTASIAATAVVFSVVAPVAGVSADTVSTDAANRLAALGVIETQVSEAGYNLNSTITRREMLKVMMNLSSIEVTETCEGKFADLPASDWGCKYAEAALMAGFIAANPTFRPDAAVTEAEALKMIMQARGVEKAEGVEPWEQAYLQAAVEAGVVASGTTLTAGAAKRSMVFVVADSAVTNASIEDDEDDFDFNLDDLLNGEWDEEDEMDEEDSTDGNTSTDGNVVVVGGDIEVSLNPTSAVNGTQIPNNGTVRFARVDLTAGDKDVSVNVIELSSVGLASVPSSTRVWFEKDGKRLSGKAAFSSDRTAVVSFAPAYVVKAGSTETLELYVELTSLSGNDFQFSGKITSSSAANNNGTFVTAALRTAEYTVVESTFNVSGSPATVNQSEDFIELGRFTVQNVKPSGVNETRDITFQNVTLRNVENGDLLDLADLHVERNGVKVSTEANVSGKDVTFILNDTVKDASTAIYYIKAKVVNVQNNSGDKYQFSIRNASDLNAIEVLNGFRTKVNVTNANLNVYTINGSDVKFSRDTSVELSQNYAKGTNNVVLLQGTITTKSPITVEDLKLGYTFNGTNTGANQLFDTVYAQIGGSTMTWTATASGTGEFLGLATINGTAQVKIYAKLRDNAPQGTFKFNDINSTSFTKMEYISNQNDVTSVVGNISAVQVSVDTTGLSIVRVDGLGNTKVAVGSSEVTVNGLNLAVNQGNDVSVSNATYTVTGSGNIANNAFATLFVDGVAVSTKTITGNSGATVNFDNLSKTIGKTPTNLTVKVNFSDAYNAGQFSMRLTNLNIVDILTSQTVSLGTIPSSAVFTVADAVGTLSVSDNNPKASLLLAGSQNQRVLAFRVKADNDTIKLRDLVFTGAGLENLSNFRLQTPTNEYVAATSNNNTTVTFANINPTHSIVMDKTETYYLVADVNTNVNASFSLTLDQAQTNVRASNGSVKDAQGDSVNSNTHLVAENTAVVAKSTNASKNLTTSALRFTVTASGQNSVTLSGASFNNLFSGYTTTGAKLVVYKDSISPSNKLGETSVGDVTGNVSFNAQNTVDSGSTNTYVVVLEGILASSGANTLDWSVSMSNLEVVSGDATINANAYSNMGEFPLTETR